MTNHGMHGIHGNEDIDLVSFLCCPCVLWFVFLIKAKDQGKHFNPISKTRLQPQLRQLALHAFARSVEGSGHRFQRQAHGGLGFEFAQLPA